MTDDGQELSFGQRAFEEILRLGKWIIARRTLVRSDVFERDVETALSELDGIHNDFLGVLVNTRGSIRELVSAKSRGSNTVSDFLKEAGDQIAEAQAALEKGRVGRRHLYEKCLARYVQLNSIDDVQALERIAYFGEHEIELLLRFHEALLSYFRTEANSYNHEMRNLLQELNAEIGQASHAGLDEDAHRRLEEMISKLLEKEKQFVEDWSTAVGFRYELELKLK